MAPKVLNCDLCKRDGKEFFVTVGDPIGVEIMKTHLKEVHQVSYPSTIRDAL